MTPRTFQAARTLDPGERVELRFQTLADLGVAGVQNPPKVLGLMHISTACGNPMNRWISTSHRRTADGYRSLSPRR
jgi:hypothetical protein